MIKPYYQTELGTLYLGDCETILSEMESESVDLIVTDPPYGYAFMGKDWDRAVPSVEKWERCLRVLKPGAFAFVMSAPRQDVLSHMIINLEKTGFAVGFTSIYWTYATGFPKAQNIGKAVDKRLGVGRKGCLMPTKQGNTVESEGAVSCGANGFTDVFAPVSPEAKALDGAYGGFQPKPAVEVILVVMKPLSEKTYVEQAMKNRKGITWLDDGRVPCGDEQPQGSGRPSKGHSDIMTRALGKEEPNITPPQGRFPANLLVSDDVLNDGRDYDRGGSIPNGGTHDNEVYGKYSFRPPWEAYGDAGSFSRYFDLDEWVSKTFPFLIVPKASKGEKNTGCEGLPLGEAPQSARSTAAEGRQNALGAPRTNHHPTVKPCGLMSYLITIGSRKGDVVLDPFMGSGTTGVACKALRRDFVGIEISEDYCDIAIKRIEAERAQLKLKLGD